MSSSRRSRSIPPRLEAGRQRFERWRAQRTGRARIPEALWCTAVELAVEFGVHRTAKVLRLNYETLKARVNHAAPERDSHGACSSGASSAKFVELLAGTLLGAGQCLVELDDGHGARMCVHLEHAEATVLAALASAFVRGAR